MIKACNSDGTTSRSSPGSTARSIPRQERRTRRWACWDIALTRNGQAMRNGARSCSARPRCRSAIRASLRRSPSFESKSRRTNSSATPGRITGCRVTTRHGRDHRSPRRMRLRRSSAVSRLPPTSSFAVSRPGFRCVMARSTSSACASRTSRVAGRTRWPNVAIPRLSRRHRCDSCVG